MFLNKILGFENIGRFELKNLGCPRQRFWVFVYKKLKKVYSNASSKTKKVHSSKTLTLSLNYNDGECCGNFSLVIMFEGCSKIMLGKKLLTDQPDDPLFMVFCCILE